MAIAKPGRRLMQSVKLPFVRKRVSGGGQRPIIASLSLTSMIDFLVVSVVFLLLTFSPSEAATERSVTVPTAKYTMDMIDAPMVSVAGSQIIVDGSAAGNTRNIEQGRQMQRLDELSTILKAKRETWKLLHPGREFPGVVVLQIDQDAPSVVVKSLFQTAAYAGYPNVSFMVGREASR